MAEGNGQQDNLSRLDRIERALEPVVDEHEAFRAERKMLLRTQVLLQGSLEKRTEKLEETGGKLDALISIVDHNSREFHDRLKRPEEKQ